MTTLRFLFVLLVALNALAFAAIKGWLGSAAPHGEPERITNQLNPAQIRLISGTTEPAVVAEAAHSPEPTSTEPEAPASAQGQGQAPEPSPPVATSVQADTASAPEASPSRPPGTEPVASCVAWSDLTVEQAELLATRLGSNGIKFVRTRKETPANWWVRIPPQGGRATAEQKVRELRDQGVPDTFIVQESGPTQFAVSLGLFRTERAAQQLLTQLRAKGVREAGIEPRMTSTFRIQATLPQDRIAAVEGRRSKLSSLRTRCGQ